MKPQDRCWSLSIDMLKKYFYGFLIYLGQCIGFWMRSYPFRGCSGSSGTSWYWCNAIFLDSFHMLHKSIKSRQFWWQTGKTPQTIDMVYSLYPILTLQHVYQRAWNHSPWRVCHIWCVISYSIWLCYSQKVYHQGRVFYHAIMFVFINPFRINNYDLDKWVLSSCELISQKHSQIQIRYCFNIPINCSDIFYADMKSSSHISMWENNGRVWCWNQ